MKIFTGILCSIAGLFNFITFTDSYKAVSDAKEMVDKLKDSYYATTSALAAAEEALANARIEAYTFLFTALALVFIGIVLFIDAKKNSYR